MDTIWTVHLECHVLCLSVVLLGYRITCLWFCNRRFCNKKGCYLCQMLYIMKLISSVTLYFNVAVRKCLITYVAHIISLFILYILKNTFSISVADLDFRNPKGLIPSLVVAVVGGYFACPSKGWGDLLVTALLRQKTHKLRLHQVTVLVKSSAEHLSVYTYKSKLSWPGVLPASPDLTFIIYLGTKPLSSDTYQLGLQLHSEAAGISVIIYSRIGSSNLCKGFTKCTLKWRQAPPPLLLSLLSF